MSELWVVNVARATCRRPRRLVGAAGAAALVVALAAVPGTGAAAAGRMSYPVLQNVGPRYTTAGGAAVLPTTRTVPHWNGSFVDGADGQTYGYNMVGTPPAGSGSTTVGVDLIPLNVSFTADGGWALDASTETSWVEASPIFTPTPMPSGETAQYLDAVMRSEFNQIGSGYHVQLSPNILPAASITVPPNQGQLYYAQDEITVLGLVNQAWFAAQVQSLLASSQLDPTRLHVVITTNVFLYQKSAVNCCTLGFHGGAHPTGMGTGSAHGNGDQPVQTFAWASWVPSPDIFGAGSTDVVALSHEISEWGHDPFDTNDVNPWLVKGSGYGCTKLLETGDPLVGVDFPAGSTNPEPTTGPAPGPWDLQDEAFLWWFARNATQASNGAYSYIGTFGSPAPTC